MQIAGIIIEYNPMHRGHAYLLEQVRAHLGADTALIGVMSGNFVQRGDFAIVRKHARARAALESGMDLVLELTLPEELEEISSTRIREAVDANRDISHLIDPMAQEFIYRHSLYLREPLDKPVLRTEDLEFIPCGPEEERLSALLRRALPASAAETVLRALGQSGDDVLLLTNG